MNNKNPHEMILAHQQRIAELNAEADEPGSALEYLQDIYKGKRAADHVRMRAAKECLPFETPRLQVTGYLRDDASFAQALERAIQRSAAGRVTLELTANAEADGGEGKVPPA
jgi:hypothetical protein